MNKATRYLGLAFELPAIMLVLAYVFEALDGPQQTLGGNGGLIGMVMAIILWVIHITFLIKNSNDG